MAKSSVLAKRAVIANEVKQSMTPVCMDCRAVLAVTKPVFKDRLRHRAV